MKYRSLHLGQAIHYLCLIVILAFRMMCCFGFKYLNFSEKSFWGVWMDHFIFAGIWKNRMKYYAFI